MKGVGGTPLFAARFREAADHFFDRFRKRADGGGAIYRTRFAHYCVDKALHIAGRGRLAGLHHGGHALVLFEEAPGPGARLLVAVPVEAFGEEQALCRGQAEAVHVRDEEQERRHDLVARQAELARPDTDGVQRAQIPFAITTAPQGLAVDGSANPPLRGKIQFNTAVETVRELGARIRTNPMVAVSVRSDGSIESVNFVVSSGVPETDEAIRRLIESHRPYPPFPPALAREFDVVEIRRTWYFDSAVRLQ